MPPRFGSVASIWHRRWRIFGRRVHLRQEVHKLVRHWLLHNGVEYAPKLSSNDLQARLRNAALFTITRFNFGQNFYPKNRLWKFNHAISMIGAGPFDGSVKRL